MPVKSPAQARFMEGVAHDPGFAPGVPQSVGKEFIAATPHAKLAKALSGKRAKAKSEHR